MTSGSNRVLDELAKLVTDAAGAAQGVRREVETALRSQSERVLHTLDVVQREDFEAVREMAIKARAENAALLAKIEALEARLAKFEVDSTAKTPKNSAQTAKSKDNS
ncbi:accessory factor UbiK family protein [Brucella sp. TWI432]|uniref:accessory factor UbiK family protein n=1 Tax=Ochrobactrum sp. S1502_03 TaxID=3108451 RepID=UPI00320BD567